MPPDFGSPVAANVQVPSITSSLSGLMGIKLQQQQLQLGQQNLQTGENTAQAAQQTMQERQRVTQMLQSGTDDQGNSIRGVNGEPDPAKVLPALGRMAPLTGQEYAQGILKTQTAKVALQTASTALGASHRQALAGPIQAVATNPTDDMVDQASAAVNQWAQQHPEMAPVADNVKTLLGHVANAKDPRQRAHMANALSALLQPSQAVQTQPQGATVDNGTTVQSGTTAPPVAGGGFAPTTSVPKQVGPGQQDAVETDAQGNRYIVSRSPSGAIVSTRPVPGTQGAGGQGSGPVNLPANMTAGQRDALSREVSEQATQAGQAGGIHAINQQIYDLAGQPSTTNKYGEIGSTLRRSIGFDPLPGSNADDYDSMTKMVAQSNMRTAQAMGVHTDQQSAQVAQASGSQHYSPTALKNVVSVNDAMVKAQQMYASGLSNAVQTKGYGAANNFKTQWGNTFDLGAAEYMAAKDSGSATRLAEVKAKLGLSDPAKASALLAKVKAMHDVAGLP